MNHKSAYLFTSGLKADFLLKAQNELIMLLTLTNVPVTKPRKPKEKKLVKLNC